MVVWDVEGKKRTDGFTEGLKEEEERRQQKGN